jgi:hypothetical protein
LLNKKLEAQQEWDIESFSSPIIALPNCDSEYSFKLKGDPDNGYEIISVGKAGNAERTVYSQLALKGLFDYAIFVADDLELKMGTTVDAYNLDPEDPPLQIATNTTDAGALDMKMGVTVDGDVVVGPSGDPDVVIDSKLEANITGDTYTLPETWDLPSIIVPPELLALSSKGVLAGNKIITEDSKFDSVNITNNEVVLINGDVRLLITGNIDMDNAAQIQVVSDITNPDACLTLYLGGNMAIKTDSSFNNIKQDAHALTIYGLDTCQTIDFLTDCVFYGAIYAPNADVRLFCEVEIFGSIVADTFIQAVDANFHYDASLRDVEITDVGVSFEIARWREQ